MVSIEFRVCLFFFIVVFTSCSLFKPNLKTNGETIFAKFEDENTLGGNLENEFDNILYNCDINKLFFSKNNISSIPSRIIRLINPNQDIQVIEGTSANKMLGFVFDEPNLDLYLNPSESLDNKSFLSSELVDFNELPTQPDGNTRLNYFLDCNTLVDFAVDLGGPKFIPKTSLEAAARSNFENRESLILFEGNFTSPYASAINNGTFRSTLPLLFNVWNWYLLNLGRVGELNYILNSYKGIALMKVSEEGRQIDINANLFTNIANTEIQATLSNNLGTKLRYTGYSTIVFKDNSTGQQGLLASFDILKNPIELKDEISKIEPEPVFQETPVITADVDLSLEYDISGIPNEFCEKEDWSISESFYPDIISSVELNNVFEIINPSTDTKDCRFKFIIKPKSSLITDEVNFNIEIESAKSITFQNTDINLQITFPLELLSNQYPKLEALDFVRLPEILGSANELIWKRKLKVNDQNEILDMSIEPLIDTSRLECGEDIKIRSRISDYTSTTGEFNLEIFSPFNYSDFSDYGYTSCNFRAEFILQNNFDKRLKRSITLNFQYPIEETIINPYSDYTPSSYSDFNISESELREIYLADSDFETITIGDTVSAQFDYEKLSLSNGTLATGYNIQVSAGDSIEVNLTSNFIDPYLYVLGPNNLFLENDDANLNVYDSKISFRASESGLYFIVANQYYQEVGSYFLYTVIINDE